MYEGELYLSYEDEDVEDHYCADISRFSLSDGRLQFEFSGASDGHKFTGRAVLENRGDRFIGVGEFKKHDKNPIKSNVSLVLKMNGENIEIEGAWKDEGDKEPYVLDADIWKKK